MPHENPLNYATPQPSAGPRPGAGAAFLALVAGASFAAWTLASVSSRGAIPIAFWVASPYVVLAAMAWFIATGRAASGVVIVTVVAMAAFGWWAFDAVDAAPQGGLVLLIAPLYQLAAAVLASGVVLVLRHLHSRRALDERTVPTDDS